MLEKIGKNIIKMFEKLYNLSNKLCNEINKGFRGCGICLTSIKLEKTNKGLRGCDICLTPSKLEKTNKGLRGCGICLTPLKLGKTN
jgi:hypothetical protein